MSEIINGHQVEENRDSDAINFSCEVCGIESNFKVTFRRESCN